MLNSDKTNFMKYHVNNNILH